MTSIRTTIKYEVNTMILSNLRLCILWGINYSILAH